MASNIQQIDSLIANEFGVEINGIAVSGVFRVSNLQTYATNDAGQRIKPPFEVTKMVQRDPNQLFNQWLQETLAARDDADKPRRDVTIVAIDDGVETRRWTAKNAWLQGIAYSDFDSASSEMVAEILTISYEDIEETWPTATN